MLIPTLKHLRAIKRLQAVCTRALTGINQWDEEISSELKCKIEAYWSEHLTKEHYNPPLNNGNNKYYVLSMFPYPSGNLHMGHVRVYAISDSIARFQRMHGKHVIHPIGWDAFGLPAENAAIERGVAPKQWTQQNIAQMKEQLIKLGCSFQWEREIATCNVNYYKWTQELFLKLFDAGLVYQNESVVNWDPIDQTVLADEQVDENGCSWRSGAKVERKPLKQWFIRTTRFAKDLLEGLNDPILQDWRDIIKLQQHWIGDCNGVSFDFKIVRNDDVTTQFVSLWTDKPEYIKHAKFLIVSPNHILGKNSGDLINQSIKTDVLVQNPFNKDLIPVYISELEIDFPHGVDSHLGIPCASHQDSCIAYKYHIKFDKTPERHDSADDICLQAQELKIGGFWTSPKLKDWLVSRQRYWGTPIPIIHCPSCGPLAVPRHNLPITLSSSPSSVTCHKCGNANANRETDTLDTFVDSSWYYLRYLSQNEEGEMFNVKDAQELSPVDLYIGGKEHAILHLYYARFISYFLHSSGLLKQKEPFKRLLVQGMVMGRSFRIKGTGQYLAESDVKVLDYKKNKATSLKTGEPVVMQWEKMSKSKLNGVSPIDMFNEYSVDTTRLLILADVAPMSHRNWNSNTFPGIINWQRRLWLTVQGFLKHRREMPANISETLFKEQEDFLFDSRNYYIKGATFNYCASQQISVAISKMQGLTNSLRKASASIFAHSVQFERALSVQIILLAPIAPHFASELWSGFCSAPNRLSTTEEIKWDKSVLEQKWPEVDMEYELDLVCQVNGQDDEEVIVKMQRCLIEQLSKEGAVELALKESKIQDLLKNRSISDISYTLHPGYEAVLNISAYKNDVEKSKLRQ